MFLQFENDIINTYAIKTVTTIEKVDEERNDAIVGLIPREERFCIYIDVGGTNGELAWNFSSIEEGKRVYDQIVQHLETTKIYREKIKRL